MVIAVLCVLLAVRQITAITDMVLYHMHVDQFFKCAAPELIRCVPT